MTDLFAYIGGIAAMLSFIPQIVKSWRTRSTSDISWLMLITTLVSVSGYEVYAIVLGLVPVAVMNGTLGLTVLVMMLMKIKFDRNKAVA